MKKYNVFTALVLFFGLIFTSCNSDVLTSQITTLPIDGWKTENKLSFTVDVKDNAPLYNFYVNVRHADAYPFSNVYLFLTTANPSGKLTVDTIECILANKNGEWQGDGAGDIWDNKIPLKQNLKFPQNGKYTFTFEQGMRVNPLPLIMDFGITVEKAKQ